MPIPLPFRTIVVQLFLFCQKRTVSGKIKYCSILGMPNLPQQHLFFTFGAEQGVFSKTFYHSLPPGQGISGIGNKLEAHLDESFAYLENCYGGRLAPSTV